MDEALNYIRQARALLSGYSADNGPYREEIETIETRIGRILPEEVRSFLSNSQDAPQDAINAIFELFYGYEPISAIALAKMYSDPESGEGNPFLACITPPGQLRSDLIVPSSCAYTVSATLQREGLDESQAEEITDLKRLIPIMDGGSGFHIAIFYTSEGATEVVIATQDGYLYSIAPSLSDHLKDIELGISQGSYLCTYSDEEQALHIEMPEIWAERAHALSST